MLLNIYLSNHIDNKFLYFFESNCFGLGETKNWDDETKKLFHPLNDRGFFAFEDVDLNSSFLPFYVFFPIDYYANFIKQKQMNGEWKSSIEFLELE